MGKLKSRDRLWFIPTDPSCAFCRCEAETHAHLFFTCNWTGSLWARIKAWLRIGRRMLTINSALRGLYPKRSNLVSRMRRVSLGITVYLIWEERNKRVFDVKSRGVDTIFRRFQILFYIVFHFHEKDHLQLVVGWTPGIVGFSSLRCVAGALDLCFGLHGFLVCMVKVVFCMHFYVFHLLSVLPLHPPMVLSSLCSLLLHCYVGCMAHADGLHVGSGFWLRCSLY